MKERPILFSAPMVQALLAGRKTQTRRAVKPQPVYSDVAGAFASWVFKPKGPMQLLYPNAEASVLALCPYGQRGDRLWVRETYWGDKTTKAFRWYVHPDLINPDRERDHVKLIPGIFMSKAIHRIDLEITGVRVERLQEITEDDASAEGVRRIGEQFENFPNDGPNKYTVDVGFHFNQPTAVACYAYLWDHINGEGAWDKNPWVWVVEFKT